MAAGKCLTYITAGSMREAAWVCEALNGHTYPGLTVEPMEAVIARPHPDQGGQQQYIPQVVHRTTEQEWVPPELAHLFVRPYQGPIPSMKTRAANSRHRFMYHDGHSAMLQKQTVCIGLFFFIYALYIYFLICVLQNVMCQIEFGIRFQSFFH